MMDTKQVRQSLLQDSAVVDAIRRRAHQLSLERGYSTPQHMAEDWFRAENEVLDRLVEEEIRRRQKMNAAISEGAMAEEAIPAVVLPPSLAKALNPPRSEVKKSSARRKKAATTEAAAPETPAPDASATVGPSTAASPATEVVPPGSPKRKRKSSAGVTAADQALPPVTLDPAPDAPPSKPKAATSAKSKASKKKSA
jgi:hypothetical protein